MNIGAIHRMTQGASAQTNYSSVQSLAVMRENELRYVRVQNCNFGGITSLAIFTKPIIDRFMSGYAQIAYFEAKHVRKRFSNEYESLSVYRDPEARFEKFLSAYSMASTRAKIPLLNHIETMMTDYNPIKYCFNK